MPLLRLRLCVFWLLTAFVVPSLAQTSRLFQWKFANIFLSTSLPTCITLPIVVQSFDPTTNATNGTPPYYMIAFAVGATPVTTLIGTDENNLSWTITEPVGSELILSVVDANGSAGGIPPRPFTVIAGSTTQCVTTPILTPAFTVTANVTGDLQTCQPWGFTVKGGVPPYTITLAEPNSPVVTNVTMPFGDDSFTYINRADPNGQLIGAISDLTGRWATGTPIVNTKGSADVSCVGLVSSSGNATTVQQATSSASSKQQHSLAIGLSVTFVLLALMGAGVVGFIYLRKRQRRRQETLSNTTPHQFVEIEAQMPSVRNVANNLESSSAEPQGGVSSGPVPIQRPGGESAPGHYRNPTAASSAAGLSYMPSVTGSDGGASSTVAQPQPRSSVPPGLRPGFTRFPTTSVRRSAKSIEARATSAPSPDSEYPVEAVVSNNGGHSMGRQTSARETSAGGIDEEPEVTHPQEDSNTMRELPPPYADQRGVDRTS